MTSSTLDPELVAKVKALTPEQRDALFDAVHEDEDLPPEIDANQAWARIEKQRDDYLAGRIKGLSREEAEKQIRSEIRKLGIEL